MEEDSRRFIRVTCENVLAYSVLKPDGGVNMARSGYVHCKNISQGGVLFTAFESIKEGTHIQMKLRLETATSKEETVAMLGGVVRYSERVQGKQWDIAISITFIEETKKEVFVNWLTKRIQNL